LPAGSSASRIVAIDPTTAAQHVLSTGGSLSLVAGLVVYSKPGGSAAAPPDSGLPADTVQAPMDGSDMSSPVVPNATAATNTPPVSGNATKAIDTADANSTLATGTSVQPAVDSNVSIVTVSNDSSVPSTNPATAGPNQATLAEQVFAAEMASQSDSAPWGADWLWGTADTLSKSLHPGDSNGGA